VAGQVEFAIAAGAIDVIGGVGGRYMIDEMRRGACGFAPISAFTDVLVRIWNEFHAGNESLAMDIHDRLASMLNIEFQVGSSSERNCWVCGGC